MILKASAGGGGKGMRVARDARELRHAFDTARHEAERAFGVADVYLEKYLTAPRHIEVQVMADARRQGGRPRRARVLDPAAPPEADRGGALAGRRRRSCARQMCEAAVAAAEAVGYVSAGTVEFLYDDGEFYFMEMNTRIQVEHPVTEAVTGVDLVLEQLRVADGQPLSIRAAPEDRRARHRVPHQRRGPGDVRALARDDHRAGVPGRAGGAGRHPHLPGYRVPPYYDSLLAKLDRASGETGSEAIRAGQARARRCSSIGGVQDLDPAPPADHRGRGLRRGAAVDRSSWTASHRE